MTGDLVYEREKGGHGQGLGDRDKAIKVSKGGLLE